MGGEPVRVSDLAGVPKGLRPDMNEDIRAADAFDVATPRLTGAGREVPFTSGVYYSKGDGEEVAATLVWYRFEKRASGWASTLFESRALDRSSEAAYALSCERALAKLRADLPELRKVTEQLDHLRLVSAPSLHWELLGNQHS